MSTEVDRLKKLITNDMVVDAVEVPTNHQRDKAIVIDDLHEALARFDDDADYAHFVVRVKRNATPLPKADPNASNEQTEKQFSIDDMVNETYELTDQLTGERDAAPDAPLRGPAGPVQEEPATPAAVAPTDEYDSAFLFENAKLLEESGDFALARNIFGALVRKGMMIPQGLAGMARTYEKEGHDDRAVRCYQEAIAYSSELPFYQGMAAIQIRMGEDESAAQTILHALGLANIGDQDKFDLHKSLGNCYTRMGEYDKAEHHYRKAYELNSQSDVLQVNVGSLALQKADLDAAQKHFQKALELNKGNEKAISGLGMVYLGRNNLEKAHDCFVAALKLNLNNLGAIYNLVKCAYDLKKYNDAAQILSAYIASNPVNTNILYSYAGILFHQGEYRQAMTEVGKILETNPNHAGAKELGDLIKSKLV